MAELHSWDREGMTFDVCRKGTFWVWAPRTTLSWSTLVHQAGAQEEKFGAGLYSPEIKQPKSREHRDSSPLGLETQDSWRMLELDGGVHDLRNPRFGKAGPHPLCPAGQGSLAGTPGSKGVWSRL